MTRSQKLAIALGIFGLAAAAYASETIKYSYDARGRLIEVNRTGTGTGTTNNVVTNYTIDKADNRTNKTTTGSPNAGPP
jgi:hypothetical protein